MTRLLACRDQECEQALVDKGFVVIDSALDNDTCAVFREEIRSLHCSQKLKVNSTHLVRAGERTLLQKEGIYEAEVADQVWNCQHGQIVHFFFCCHIYNHTVKN